MFKENKEGMPPTATQTVTRVNPEKFTVDSLFACQQISVWINFKTTTVIISLRQRCLQNEKHEPCRSLPLGWSVHRSRPSHLRQVFCRNVCWSSSRASSEHVPVRMKQRRCRSSSSTRCTSPGDHENSDLYVLICCWLICSDAAAHHRPDTDDERQF